jgi:hypothetical protein
LCFLFFAALINLFDRAALLFQSAMDLTYVDPMYQFSLGWFVDLFVMAINESKTAKVTDKVLLVIFHFYLFTLLQNRIPERVAELNDYFTYLVYKHVSGSIFENHKLLHSFMLAVKLVDPREIDPVEWKFFISGYPKSNTHLFEISLTLYYIFLARRKCCFGRRRCCNYSTV